MTTLEATLIREAALRVMFPATAGDSKRSRAPRNLLLVHTPMAVRASAEALIRKEPWRGTWE